MFTLFNIWLISPCKGVLAAAKIHNMPKMLQKTTGHGVPITILLLQSWIATLLMLVYLWMPTIEASYWMLLVLSSLLDIIVSILLFSSVVRLRYIQPKTPRAYKIPGKLFGVWLVAGTIVSICTIAFFLGFIPPDGTRRVGMDGGAADRCDWCLGRGALGSTGYWVRTKYYRSRHRRDPGRLSAGACDTLLGALHFVVDELRPALRQREFRSTTLQLRRRSRTQPTRSDVLGHDAP